MDNRAKLFVKVFKDNVGAIEMETKHKYRLISSSLYYPGEGGHNAPSGLVVITDSMAGVSL